MDPRIPLDYAAPHVHKLRRRDKGGCLLGVGAATAVVGMFVAHATLTYEYAGLLERREYLLKAGMILVFGMIVIAFGLAKNRRGRRADKDEVDSR